MEIDITPTAEPALLHGLRELHKAVTVTRDSLPFETSRETLGDALCELVGLQTEIDSLRLQLIDQCRSNGVPQSVGVRTVGQYVAARTNNAAAASNIDTAMNRWLRDFPIFVEALAERDMTLAHLRYIKKHLFSGRSFDSLRDDQHFFVTTARDCSFAGFTAASDYWLNHIDPDGKEPQDQIAKSGLRMRKGLGGRGHIEIETDAVSYTAFKKMIDHQVDKQRAERGNEPNEAFIANTLAFERLQALCELTKRGFQREDGTFPTPLFNIVMSPAVVDWAIRQLREPSDGRVPVDPFDVDGRCELIDGTPIHPLLAVAITGLWKLDTPTLCRYVLDAKDRIIDFSYNSRVAPEHLRQAAHIEHRGACAVPGCDAPHRWLQIDHVDPHSNGGPTSLRNSEPQCRPDNQAKGATLGHIPYKDRPKPPRYHRRSNNTDDEDAA